MRQALRGLIYDKGRRTLSLGRTAFWLLLSASLYIWLWRSQDIPTGLLTVLLGLLAYVTSDKAVQVAGQVVGRRGSVPRTVTVADDGS